jgi:hypothetical protein
MNSTELNEQIRSLSNSELLSILDQPENYLPLAIEIAKEEAFKRVLTEEDISDARSARLENENQRQLDKQKFESLIRAPVRFIGNILSAFDPNSEIPPLERSIRIITIVYGGLAAYHVLSRFKLQWYLLSDFNRDPFISFFRYSNL